MPFPLLFPSKAHFSLEDSGQPTGKAPWVSLLTYHAGTGQLMALSLGSPPPAPTGAAQCPLVTFHQGPALVPTHSSVCIMMRMDPWRGLLPCQNLPAAQFQVCEIRVDTQVPASNLRVTFDLS